jgi:hypothetical protein
VPSSRRSPCLTSQGRAAPNKASSISSTAMIIR